MEFAIEVIVVRAATVVFVVISWEEERVVIVALTDVWVVIVVGMQDVVAFGAQDCA